MTEYTLIRDEMIAQYKFNQCNNFIWLRKKYIERWEQIKQEEEKDSVAKLQTANKIKTSIKSGEKS